ncbi:HAD family hydrolase [Haloferula chungangensis]|uniref:HAD family hydrolase n=1 Tax=Haloferula chungangensis TaxID=1048331 RepID=A0ABW2L9B8_9BACT
MHFPEIRIIFQDVDGCLNPADGEDFGVTPEWEASESQIAMLHAIDKAVEASPIEHFVINTGRFWPILENIVRHFSSPKIRYFVMEHACVIHDRLTGTNLDLAELAKSCGMPELAHRYTSLDTMKTLLKWYDEHGQPAMEALYQVPMPRLDKVGNLSFAFPPESHGEEVLAAIEAKVQEGLTEADYQSLEFCCSDRFVDILPGIHKMDGIELMCAHLGIHPDQALAVGDYLNDLAVFETFPQVMCPANAHPRIKTLTAEKAGRGYVSDQPYGKSLIELLENLSQNPA